MKTMLAHTRTPLGVALASTTAYFFGAYPDKWWTGILLIFAIMGGPELIQWILTRRNHASDQNIS